MNLYSGRPSVRGGDLRPDERRRHEGRRREPRSEEPRGAGPRRRRPGPVAGGGVRVVAGCLLAAAVLAGCEGSVSLGGSSVAKGEVEDQIAAKFGPLFQRVDPPVEVACPESLEAEVGVTMQCALTDPGDGATYPVNVSVDSVNGDDTHFNLDLVGVTAVDETDVEGEIVNTFGTRFQSTDLSADCPASLRAKVGVEMQCALTDPADGTTYPVAVTVDSVDGANTAFSFELGEPADA